MAEFFQCPITYFNMERADLAQILGQFTPGRPPVPGAKPPPQAQLPL